MEPGVRCGDYELLEPIGNGSGRPVWQAIDACSQRLAAIKRFAPCGGHPLAARRLYDEVKAIFQLASERGDELLVPLYDMGADGDRTWVASQLLTAPSLEQMSVAGSLSAVRAAELVARVAESLDALHGRGIVHTNLKPANVFADESGNVALADPFLVGVLGPRLLEEEFPLALINHLAPELLHGAAFSPVSDQYALGVLAYRLLAGALPFHASSSLDYFFATVYMPPLALPGHVDGAGRLDQVVRRALDPDPAARFRDCRGLARDLVAATKPCRGGSPVTGAEKAAEALRPRAPAPPVAPPPATKAALEPTSTPGEPDVPAAVPSADCDSPGEHQQSQQLQSAAPPGRTVGSDDVPAPSPPPVAVGELPENGNEGVAEEAAEEIAPAATRPSGARKLRALWRTLAEGWSASIAHANDSVAAQRFAYNRESNKGFAPSGGPGSDDGTFISESPILPTWSLTVRTARQGTETWINGAYVADAPGDLQFRGKANERVKVELRSDESEDSVVAATYLVLSPFMAKQWDADADDVLFAGAGVESEPDDSE